ncbi:hypothetical protein CPB84DRAFT_1813218 [Gymnopilus junonius]|uniref:Non-haem dioxygenase N-terminal domain-containing protein n=1 Tax=Gymnopilus junonius TaxID=109634 RepID=A0A9P5NWD1_GYMJU|nr:hypothetical protein CPB84DRAFT_1813218 [Gymnopilus junonius]
MSSSGILNALPIIDIAPFLNFDPADAPKREATAAALHSACVEYGFFYLNIKAYVDPSEPEELARLAREFFALPQEEKDMLSLKNQDSARGYARLKENMTNGKADNHEGVDFYKPVDHPDKTKPVWGENQWPTIPGFKDKYDTWIENMKILGLILMEAMSIGLGMTREEWQDLRGQVDDSFWVMRIIGYPPLPNDHDGFSCGAHNFLYADPTPSALQVFLRRPGVFEADNSGLPLEQGQQEGIWINADPIPGCVVCNIGESEQFFAMLFQSSDLPQCGRSGQMGFTRSTLHRVVHRGSNYRIPFFFEPNFTALVKPLAAVSRSREKEGKHQISEQVRKPVVYGDFLVNKVGNNFAVNGKGKYD